MRRSHGPRPLKTRQASRKTISQRIDDGSQAVAAVAA
jgi:hypothetical protein